MKWKELDKVEEAQRCSYKLIIIKDNTDIMTVSIFIHFFLFNVKYGFIILCPILLKTSILHQLIRLDFKKVPKKGKIFVLIAVCVTITF